MNCFHLLNIISNHYWNEPTSNFFQSDDDVKDEDYVPDSTNASDEESDGENSEAESEEFDYEPPDKKVNLTFFIVPPAPNS